MDDKFEANRWLEGASYEELVVEERDLSAMDAAINLVQSALDNLDKTVNVLENRLDPVTNKKNLPNQNADYVGGDEVDDYNSMIVQVLHSFRDKIDARTRELLTLIAHLDI